MKRFCGGILVCWWALGLAGQAQGNSSAPETVWSLEPGWNLVAVPSLSVPRLGARPLASGSVWPAVAGEGSESPSRHVRVLSEGDHGEGLAAGAYWVHSGALQQVALKGLSVRSSTISLPGWRFLWVAEETVYQDPYIHPLLRWDSESASYRTVSAGDLLEPGEGYLGNVTRSVVPFKASCASGGTSAAPSEALIQDCALFRALSKEPGPAPFPDPFGEDATRESEALRSEALLPAPVPRPGVFEPARGLDTPAGALALSRAALSPFEGQTWAYVAHVRRGRHDEIWVYRSDKAGKPGSFTAAAPFRSGGSVVELSIAAREGRVFVAWISEESESFSGPHTPLVRRLWAAESTDGGQSFDPPMVVRENATWKRGLDGAYDIYLNHHLVWGEGHKAYYLKNLAGVPENVFDVKTRAPANEVVKHLVKYDPGVDGRCACPECWCEESYLVDQADPADENSEGGYVYRTEESQVYQPSLTVSEDAVTIVVRQFRMWDNRPVSHPAWNTMALKPVYADAMTPGLYPTRSVVGWKKVWKHAYESGDEALYAALGTQYQYRYDGTWHEEDKIVVAQRPLFRGAWSAANAAGPQDAHRQSDGVSVLEVHFTPNADPSENAEPNANAEPRASADSGAEPLVAGWRKGTWHEGRFQSWRLTTVATVGDKSGNDKPSSPRVVHAPWGLAVVYEDGPSDDPNVLGFNPVRVQTSSDGGRSWSAPTSVGAGYVPAMGVTESGHMSVLAYVPRTASAGAVVAFHSHDGGETFGDASTLNQKHAKPVHWKSHGTGADVLVGGVSLAAHEDLFFAAWIEKHTDLGKGDRLVTSRASSASEVAYFSVSLPEYVTEGRRSKAVVTAENIYHMRVQSDQVLRFRSRDEVAVDEKTSATEVHAAAATEPRGGTTADKGAIDAVHGSDSSSPVAAHPGVVGDRARETPAGRGFSTQGGIARSDAGDHVGAGHGVGAAAAPPKSAGGLGLVSLKAGQASVWIEPSVLPLPTDGGGLGAVRSLSSALLGHGEGDGAVLEVSLAEARPSERGDGVPMFAASVHGNLQKALWMRNRLWRDGGLSAEGRPVGYQVEYQVVGGDAADEDEARAWLGAPVGEGQATDAQYLAAYERVWAYTQGIALAQYARLGTPRFDAKAQALARYLCARADRDRRGKKGFRSVIRGWPFSWNTSGDNWKDARLVTGATAWVIHGLGVFLVSDAFKALSEQEQSKQRDCYAEALEGLEDHRRFGTTEDGRKVSLMTAGWTARGLAFAHNPWELNPKRRPRLGAIGEAWDYYDVLDAIGYGADVGTTPPEIRRHLTKADGSTVDLPPRVLSNADLSFIQETVQAGNVVTEHNLDVLSVLNHALNHSDELGIRDREHLEAWRNELREGIFHVLWDPNDVHWRRDLENARDALGIRPEKRREIEAALADGVWGRVSTGGDMRPGGQQPPSPGVIRIDRGLLGSTDFVPNRRHTAIDNCSWLSLSVDYRDLEDPAKIDALARCLSFTSLAFGKHIEFRGHAYYGAHYFFDGFEDRYISATDRQELSFHLEATTGLIMGLLKFVAHHPSHPQSPGFRREADALWAGVQDFVLDHGFPYSSQRILDLSTLLTSSTALIWFIDTHEAFYGRDPAFSQGGLSSGAALSEGPLWNLGGLETLVSAEEVCDPEQTVSIAGALADEGADLVGVEVCGEDRVVLRSQSHSVIKYRANPKAATQVGEAVLKLKKVLAAPPGEVNLVSEITSIVFGLGLSLSAGQQVVEWLAEGYGWRALRLYDHPPVGPWRSVGFAKVDALSGHTQDDVLGVVDIYARNEQGLLEPSAKLSHGQIYGIVVPSTIVPLVPQLPWLVADPSFPYAEVFEYTQPIALEEPPSFAPETGFLLGDTSAQDLSSDDPFILGYRAWAKGGWLLLGQLQQQGWFQRLSTREQWAYLALMLDAKSHPWWPGRSSRGVVPPTWVHFGEPSNPLFVGVVLSEKEGGLITRTYLEPQTFVEGTWHAIVPGEHKPEYWSVKTEDLPKLPDHFRALQWANGRLPTSLLPDGSPPASADSLGARTSIGAEAVGNTSGFFPAYLWSFQPPGENKPISYAFGTQHDGFALEKSDPVVQEKLGEAEAVYTEINLDLHAPEKTENVAEDRVVSKVLSQKHFAKLQQIAKALNWPTSDLANQKIETVWAWLAAGNAILVPQLDEEVASYAVTKGSYAGGLEEASSRERRQFFETARTATGLERVIDRYAEGDISKAAELAGLELLEGHSPVVYQAGVLDWWLGRNRDLEVTQRHVQWLPKIKEEAQNKKLFLAVGLAHLLGDGGIIARLRDEGWIVKLVDGHETRLIGPAADLERGVANPAHVFRRPDTSGYVYTLAGGHKIHLQLLNIQDRSFELVVTLIGAESGIEIFRGEVNDRSGHRQLRVTKWVPDPPPAALTEAGVGYLLMRRILSVIEFDGTPIERVVAEFEGAADQFDADVHLGLEPKKVLSFDTLVRSQYYLPAGRTQAQSTNQQVYESGRGEFFEGHLQTLESDRNAIAEAFTEYNAYVWPQKEQQARLEALERLLAKWAHAMQWIENSRTVPMSVLGAGTIDEIVGDVAVGIAEYHKTWPHLPSAPKMSGTGQKVYFGLPYDAYVSSVTGLNRGVHFVSTVPPSRMFSKGRGLQGEGEDVLAFLGGGPGRFQLFRRDAFVPADSGEMKSALLHGNGVAWIYTAEMPSGSMDVNRLFEALGQPVPPSLANRVVVPTGIVGGTVRSAVKIKASSDGQITKGPVEFNKDFVPVVQDPGGAPSGAWKVHTELTDQGLSEDLAKDKVLLPSLSDASLGQYQRMRLTAADVVVVWTDSVVSPWGQDGAFTVGIQPSEDPVDGKLGYVDGDLRIESYEPFFATPYGPRLFVYYVANDGRALNTNTEATGLDSSEHHFPGFVAAEQILGAQEYVWDESAHRYAPGTYHPRPTGQSADQDAKGPGNFGTDSSGPQTSSQIEEPVAETIAELRRALLGGLMGTKFPASGPSDDAVVDIDTLFGEDPTHLDAFDELIAKFKTFQSLKRIEVTMYQIAPPGVRHLGDVRLLAAKLYFPENKVQFAQFLAFSPDANSPFDRFAMAGAWDPDLNVAVPEKAFLMPTPHAFYVELDETDPFQKSMGDLLRKAINPTGFRKLTGKFRGELQPPGDEEFKAFFFGAKTHVQLYGPARVWGRDGTGREAIESAVLNNAFAYHLAANAQKAGSLRIPERTYVFWDASHLEGTAPEAWYQPQSGLIFAKAFPSIPDDMPAEKRDNIVYTQLSYELQHAFTYGFFSMMDASTTGQLIKAVEQDPSFSVSVRALQKHLGHWWNSPVIRYSESVSMLMQYWLLLFSNQSDLIPLRPGEGAFEDLEVLIFHGGDPIAERAHRRLSPALVFMLVKTGHLPKGVKTILEKHGYDDTMSSWKSKAHQNEVWAEIYEAKKGWLADRRAKEQD